MNILLSVPRQCFSYGSFVLFMYCVCHAFVSVVCSLLICWENAELLALICDVLLCFCHFPLWCPGSGVVLDLSIPDICHLSYFDYKSCFVCAVGGPKSLSALSLNGIFLFQYLGNACTITFHYSFPWISSMSCTTFEITR